VLLMSRENADKLGLKPRERFVDQAPEAIKQLVDSTFAEQRTG
jgi:hypothetical protein